MPNLLIVESPNKIKKIQEYLGPEWVIKASLGHIRDLPKRELGIGDRYNLKYELSEKGADVVKGLKYDVAKADEIFLATDPDREGEAIAWHLKEVLKTPHAKRITFNSITETAIKQAISQTRSVDEKLVRSQEARRALDRIVGFKVSGPLSDAAGTALSAGRVQSPAIRLVVDREREIQSFQSVEHYSAEVSFNENGWKAKLDIKALLESLGESSDYLLNKELAESASAIRTFKVIGSNKEPKRKAPPPPLVTSTLLQAAGNALKLSPDQVMAVAQKLYEGGHITYHRTDFPNLSDEGVAGARAEATKRSLPIPETARKFKIPKGAQEAHEAIRPTHWEVDDAGETPTEKSVYKLIWQRALTSQLSDCETLLSSLELEGSSNGDTFRFKASGSVITANGWRELTTQIAENSKDDDNDETEEGKVPSIDIGSIISAESGRLIVSNTKPPSRFTQASLIKKLEALEIGRPSTYASIISLITNRGYVFEQKGFLYPSSTGESIVDNLSNKFSFIDLHFTKELEKQLDDIACGKADYFAVISSFDGQLKQEMNGLSGPKFTCPNCNQGIRRYSGKYGPFWGCTNSDCKTILHDNSGNPGEVIVRDKTPSEKQLAFAHQIAEQNGSSIPTEALTDSRILSEWLDKQPRKETPASDAQMKWVHELVDKGAEKPPGYPDNVSAKAASALLDKHFSKTKKSKGKKK